MMNLSINKKQKQATTMTNFETELQNHITAVKAEVEAEAWNKENAERRTSFLTRRLAAVAIEDTDPFADEDFEEIAA